MEIRFFSSAHHQMPRLQVNNPVNRSWQEKKSLLEIRELFPLWSTVCWRIYVWKYFGLIRALFNSMFVKFKKQNWYQKPKSEKTKKNPGINGSFYVQMFVAFFFFIHYSNSNLNFERKKNIIHVQCLIRSWVGDKVLVKSYEQQTRKWRKNKRKEMAFQ